MRRIVSAILLFCLTGISIIAQTQEIRGSEAQPQIAYHLFSNWADSYQAEAKRGRLIGSSVMYGIGSLAIAGSAVTWFKGDAISNYATGSPIDPELRQNLTLGLGIGGGAMIIGGLILSSAPIKDYRSIYADIFQEKDPEVQEAMAVSVLRYQADKGKERRITSFISSFVVPIVAGGIKAGINVANRDPWDTDLFKSIGNSSWSMAGGIVSLFQKSPEERLYERYLNTRDALRGSIK